MTRILHGGAKALAASLGLAATFVTGPVALAATGETTTTDEAQASVVVVEPVGAGFSFDVLNDAVSAVFLNGEIGDSVSMLMTPRKAGPRDARNSGGVVVMASGVYRIDLLTPANSRMHTMRRGLLSSGLPGGSSILFLAQFN
ncbi:hypothetical protein GGQ88_000370 [Novosphingobium hassiacum]|uniref:Uncharacterized protein n=1 Tax=Novosphingobium hassiacum TaxID=173676 RepID=A0A7W6EUP3_9SPHN|nr:hypothetical protein [Novosphingobium hassiacum]MBB3859130.1 hypothetical protein [Novosphingobium hassiacum]